MMSENKNEKQFTHLNVTRNKKLKKSNTKEKIRRIKFADFQKNFSSSSLKRFSYLNNPNNINSNSNDSVNNSFNINSKRNSINTSNKIIIAHPDKHSLFLRKLDLDEKKNLYFKEGVDKLFNDKNIFLENKYKGKPIFIGKSRHFNKFLFPSSLSLFSKMPSSQKQATSRQTKIKARSISISRTNTLNQNSSSKSLINSTFYGKKCFGWRLNKNDKEENITDEKLKNIYREFLNREANNKAMNKTIDIVELNSVNKKKIGKNDITLSPRKINKVSANIINLQNQILNNYKIKNDEKEKMMDRLLKLTSKKNNKDLLMANLIDYRIKKENIEENDNIIKTKYSSNLNEYEFSQKLQWLSSLRDYETKKKNKNNNLFRCNSGTSYSFGIRDNDSVILDLSNCLYPLYAHVSPKIAEYNEKVRDTLSERKTSNGLMNSCHDCFKKRKYINLYSGLNIKGKKLLDFEMELSKELEGKKKKILYYNYRDEDVSPKIFAMSYSIDNFNTPKSVRNTLSLHINKENNN